MPGREYVCGECGHRFRAPDEMASGSRMLMCPSCGSIDLTIAVTERSRPEVVRAKQPLSSGDPSRWPKTRAS